MQYYVYTCAALLALANTTQGWSVEHECKPQQQRAAHNWDKFADHYDWACDKVDKIKSKTMAQKPGTGCDRKYQSYVEWHINEFSDNCKKPTTHECKPQQKRAAHYWKQYADDYDWACDKAHKINSKTLAKKPGNSCDRKYQSYVEWHFNEFATECKKPEPPIHKCKPQQERAARYWKQYADHYDWDCDKIDKVTRKTMAEKPRTDCDRKYQSYVEWHINEYTKKCKKPSEPPVNECKPQQERAARYWKQYADHYDWACNKLHKINRHTMAQKPDNKCDRWYQSYVEWHMNEYAGKCDRH